MRPSRPQLATLCFEALTDALEFTGRPPQEPEEGFVLLGAGATLDSLSVVQYVLDVEQRLADKYRTLVSLTDEKAMSQRQSPFRSVGTLIDYLDSLLPGAR